MHDGKVAILRLVDAPVEPRRVVDEQIGRIDEARVIYERDLGYDDELPVSRQNRGNVWSLSGLAECYEKLGDPRAADAGAALAAVLPLADQPVTSSCFCRGRAGRSGTA